MKSVLLSFTQKLIAVLAIFNICSKAAIANSGIIETSIIMQANGGSANYYDLYASTANLDFQGYNLGIFSCTNTLVIRGGQNKTYKNDSDDILNGYLYYRVYKNGTDPNTVSFTSINLTFDQNLSNPGEQQWTTVSANYNILQGLGDGIYIIEVYSSADFTYNGGNGKHYQNAGGANYKATFTISNPITVIVNPTTPIVCYGTNSRLTAAATGSDAYIWQKQNGVSWINISSGSVTSGATTTLNLTNITTTEVYRCLFTNCGGINTLPTQTVTVAPQKPTITLQPLSQSDCDGNAVDFNITVSAGNSFIWQRKKPTDASFITVTATTNSVITNATTGSQLKVKNIGNTENPHLSQYQCIITDANSCTNTTNIATLSVNSIGNIADSPTICERGTTNFTTALVGTSAAIKWQKGISETAAASYVDMTDSSPNILGTGTNILSLSNIPLIDNNTFYRVRVTFTTITNSGNGTCTQTQAVTASTTGKLTVIAKPLAPVANNASRCDEGTVTLSTSSTLGANESFRWYNSNISTTILGTNASYATTSLAVGVYTYYLSVYNSITACESIRTPVTVIVNALPTITLSNVTDICKSASSFSLPFTSTTNAPNQYSIFAGSPALSGFSEISNVALGSLNSPIDVLIPTNATPNTYQFVISVKNSTTTCVSPNQTFTVKINDTPIVPTVSLAINYCQNAPTSALTATVSSTNFLLWYGTNSVGGTSSIIAPTPSSNTIGTTTYYVSQQNTDNCESTRAAIDVIINAIPSSPSTISTIMYCKNNIAAALSATATGFNTLVWYDENDNLLASAPTPNTLIVGTQIFKVSQKSPWPANCESAKTTITVVINDLPTAPTVISPVVYCQNTTALILSATATNTNTLLWYGTNSVGGTSSLSAPTPITTSVGTTSYYVSQKDANNCEAPRAKIDVEITPRISVTIVGVNAFCITGGLNNSTILTANSIGGNASYTYQWQNLGGNILTANAQTYEVNSAVQSGNSDTYKVTVASGYCTATATLTVTKQGWNDIPIVVGNTPDICGSGSKILSVLNPSSFGSYKWFVNSTTLIQTATGTSFATPALSTTAIYYVAREQQITANLTCQTTRTATIINVNTIPETPVIVNSANKTTFCHSESGFTLSASCASGSGQYRINNGSWVAGNSVIITPSTYTSVTTINFDFKCSLNASCESATASTSVIINSAPTPPIISGNTNICLGSSTTLTASGCLGAVAWSNGVSGISITVSSAGTYNAICTSNACSSIASLTQTIIVNPVPSITLGIINPICNTATTFDLPYNAMNNSPDTYSLSAIMPEFVIVTDASLPVSPITVVIPAGKTGNQTFTLSIKNKSTSCTYDQTFTIVVLPVLQGGSIETSSTTINCAGYNAGVISSISVANGGKTPYVYQWQLSTDNQNFTDIPSENLTTYNPPAITQTTYYRRKVIDACGAVAYSSNIHQIQIVPDPKIMLTDITDRKICSGESISLEATVIGGSGTCTAVWESASTLSGTYSIERTGGLSFSKTLSNASLSPLVRYYRVSYSCAGTGSSACNQSVSSSVKTTVNYIPNAPTVSGSSNICHGNSTILTASGCAGIITWSNLTTGSTLRVSTAGTYSAICTENLCVSNSSNVHVLTVNSIPNVPTITSDDTDNVVCAGTSVKLSVSDCVGIVVWSNGTSNTSISISESGTYNAVCIVNSCSSEVSLTQAVVVNVSPSVPVISGNTSVCSGTSTTLRASGCSGTIIWNTGEKGSTLLVSIAGTYNATCTVNNCVSAVSLTHTISVRPKPVPIISGNTSFCIGASTTLTANGCSGVVTWNTGVIGSILNVSAAGTYSAICTENSCESSESLVTIISANSLPTISLGIVSSLCNTATTFDLPHTATNAPDKYSLSSTMPDFVPITESLLPLSLLSVSIPSSKTGTHTFTLNIKNSTTGCVGAQTFNINILPILSGGSIEVSSSTLNCSGYNAGVISNVVLASGGKLDYVYQWQSSTSNQSFTDIIGANSVTYDPPVLPQSTYYRRKVTDACGAVAYSSNVHQIQIVPDPQIILKDASERIICSGGSISLEANIIGGAGMCTTTWQSSSTQSGTYINEQVGGLSFTSTLTNPTTTPIIKYYRAIYACSGTGSGSCNQGISAVVKVSINPILNIPVIIPIQVVICPTQSTILTANGCNGLVTWNTGQTGRTLSISEAGNYAAICTLNNCVSAESALTTVTVASGGMPVAPPIISVATTICNGQSAILDAANCSGLITWSNGLTGTMINVKPSVSTDYTATCFDGTCRSSNSNKITVTVNLYPVITTQPKNETDCKGNSVTFSVVATSVLSYQWQRKIPNGTFTDISNAIYNTLTISNVGSSIDPNQTEYRVVLFNGNCSSTSTVAVLTVNSVVGSLVDQTICDGGNTSFNLSNITILGSLQNYQWQRRVGTAGTWNDILGATTTTLALNAVTNADEQYYRCKMNFNAGSSTCARYTTEEDSNGAKLRVVAASTPNITGTNVICLGKNTTLTANNCDGLIAWSSGQTTSSITVSPMSNTSYTITCTSMQCGFSMISVPYSITVNVAPQPEIITYDVITPTILTFAARITVPNATLMWYNRASGGVGTTTAPSFSAVGSYSYWVTQTDPITGCESARLPIVAKVLDYLHITQQPTNQVDCKGNSVYMGVIAVSPNPTITYQWQRKRPQEPDFINLVEEGNGIRGWYARTMVVSNVGDVNNPNQTQFRCLVTSNGQVLTSEISVLTVNSLSGSLPNLGICVGASNEFNLQNYFSITGNVMGYQWQTRPGTSGAWTNLNDVNGISGSASSVLKFTSATYTQGVYYRCLVKFNTQGFECIEPTDAAKLTVSGFPLAPSVSNVFYCQNSNAVKLKVDSPTQNLVWYTQEIGGTGITAVPIPNTSIVGVFKYYVADRTDEGCESSRAVINVAVGALPPAPKNTTLTSINEGEVLIFSAEGTPVENQVLRWYTSPTTSTFSTIAPTFTAPGTYSRYVAQLSAFGCVGLRTTIISTIIPNLKFTKQPISQADCDGNSVTFSVTAAAPSIFSYQWQRQKPNEIGFTDLLNETSASLKISNIGSSNAPHLTKYRSIIKDDKNIVISEEAVLTVHEIVGTLANMSLCGGKESKLTFNDLTIRGKVAEYQWQKKVNNSYTDISTNIDGVAIVNEIGTYRGKITFVVDKNTTCSRATDDLKVEVRPIPAAPQVANQNTCLNIPFDITKTVTASNTLLWYESTADTIADKTTPKVETNRLGKTTFFVSQISNFGCESERQSFDILVSSIPEKPITSDLTYCRNAPSFLLSATTSPQSQVVWYASLTAKEAFEQTPTPNTKIDGKTTYFVTAKNAAGCESERVSLKVSVAPCIVTFTNNFNECLEISADSVKGNKWYDIYDNTGRLYASVNPNGLDLGSVIISIRHYGRGSTAIPTTKNGTNLMARYVDFQSSLVNAFPTPVSLRVYYLNDELNEYKTATNLPNLTINDFKIVHYDGAVEDCSFENNDNFSEGDSYVIYKNVSGNQIAEDFFYLQFDVNEFSESAATANNYTEVAFSGKETDNQTIQLNWQSKFEVRAEKYILERSADCKNFVSVGEIKANDIASGYQSIDFQPLAGKSCYRLVYVDKEGIKKYLEVIEVNFTDTSPICSIFPNPLIKDDEINLYLRNIKEKEIELYDLLGRSFALNISKQDSKIINIRPNMHLSKGVYFLVVAGEDGKKCVQKVVITP